MIRRWLQKLFIEEWQKHECSFAESVSAVRNPNQGDLQDKRAGCVWYNATTKTEFVLKKHWVRTPKKRGRKRKINVEVK